MGLYRGKGMGLKATGWGEKPRDVGESQEMGLQAMIWDYKCHEMGL